MAKDNLGWGYDQITGALANLGIALAGVDRILATIWMPSIMIVSASLTVISLILFCSATIEYLSEPHSKR
jgi:hypothetical protein